MKSIEEYDYGIHWERRGSNRFLTIVVGQRKTVEIGRIDLTPLAPETRKAIPQHARDLAWAAEGWYISGIKVDNEWKGQGVGRLMMKELMGKPWLLVLRVMSDEDWVIGWYERLGFVQFGDPKDRRMFYYRRA